jgi:glycosyltransferase involved in cell wall biosynthesis
MYVESSPPPSKLITILVPCYNEEQGIQLVYDRLASLSSNVSSQFSGEFELEYLFVNDGSSDQTLSLICSLAQKDEKVKYINLSRNFGKEAAMLAGIDVCRGDALVVIDADLQDPPELIPQMIQLWQEGFDDVYAQRTSRKGESFIKKFTSKMYYKVLQKSTSIPIQKDTGDFRLLDRRAIDALKQFREFNRNTKALFSYIGYKKRLFAKLSG